MTRLEIFQAATDSVRRFLRLATSGLSLRKDRLGTQYDIEGASRYAIFRETVSTCAGDEPPVVLVVGFQLKVAGRNSVLHWLFQRVCICTTPFWSGFAGFRVKLWMVDPYTKDYLGVYEWRGTQNAQRYIAFLTPVLQFFSVKDSVWCHMHTHEALEPFLARRVVSVT